MGLLSRFRRLTQRCDGCHAVTGWRDLYSASGDAELCERCIQSVMMFGKYPHELSDAERDRLDASLDDGSGA